MARSNKKKTPGSKEPPPKEVALTKAVASKTTPASKTKPTAKDAVETHPADSPRPSPPRRSPRGSPATNTIPADNVGVKRTSAKTPPPVTKAKANAKAVITHHHASKNSDSSSDDSDGAGSDLQRHNRTERNKDTNQFLSDDDQDRDDDDDRDKDYRDDEEDDDSEEDDDDRERQSQPAFHPSQSQCVEPVIPRRKKKPLSEHAIQTKKRKQNEEMLKRNGSEKWIETVARQAVFDAAPFNSEGKRPKNCLYWAKSPKNHCAMQLIRSCPRLQLYAASKYKTKLECAEAIAKMVVSASRAARNKHIYQLKKLFFANDSPFQIAKHVLAGQTTNRDGEPTKMVLLPLLCHPQSTPSQLQALLMSPSMHAHQVFYNNFTTAMQCGKMSRVPKKTLYFRSICYTLRQL